jgi:DNA helicase-2/ATP-dependent DNA helicase PcrA
METTPLMDLLADLTPAQIEAVTTIEGPLLVLAAAGSGKTRVITRRIAHMLERGVPGRSILALTFTNKAAGEMRERVAALAPDSGAWVGTFHGLCARLLRRYARHVGLDPGFTIYDQADRLRVIKAVMEREGRDNLAVTPEQVESIISRSKNDMRLPGRRAAGAQDDHVHAVAGLIYPKYQEAMRAASAVDFDDLLLHMVTILKGHADVRQTLDRQYRYILVDEYQDTNLAQYAILRAIAVEYPNLCVTGDPDQSIYGWRGANLSNILEFEEDYPGTKVVTLERNYRSTGNILAVADHLIRFNKRRKPKSLTTENPTGDPVVVTTYENESDEAQAVAATISGLVERDGLAFRDIAVFCRVTALTRVFETAFRAASIPYQVIGGLAFYERQEIKDVLSYLALALNPKDDLAFRRVVNVPPRGVGKTTLDHLAAAAEARGIPLLAMARQATSVPGVKDRAASALRDFAMLMDEILALKDHAAEEVLRRLLSLSGYHKHLESDPASEDRQANVDELVSAARQFDREHPGGTLTEFLESVSLASAVDRWRDEAGAVALMTMHAAKGLEFPAVFVVGLEQGILPHARAFEDSGELEEERRLLFVGITRAKRWLWLSRARVREFRGTRKVTVPSQFLSELPEDPIEWLDRTGLSGFAPPPPPRRVPAAATSWPGRLITAADLTSSPRSTADATRPDAFRAGMQVVHPEYGLGMLVAIDGLGANRKGRVRFALGGERTFVLARSNLRPIGPK